MALPVDAMGIGSSSIYAVFGSKEDLSREAVGLYVAPIRIRPLNQASWRREGRTFI